MKYVLPSTQNEGDPKTSGPYAALAVAVAGLEAIRDEGPEADPTYPENGSIKDHDNWGFDSASYERAQTAREALESVAAIMEEGEPTPM